MLLWLLGTALAQDSVYTYVKLVDRAGFTDSEMTPGADIDAVQVVRDGTVVGHAEMAVAAKVLQGDHGNAATNAAAAIGPPDHRPRTLGHFLSLGGPGGWVVLELSVAARAGDALRVHEVGRTSGRVEETEVCVGTSPDGPFMSLGSGFGRFELVVGTKPAADDSACVSRTNS